MNYLKLKQMKKNNIKKWYEYKLLVVFLCIIFFPLGLYALWRNQFISKVWKIGGTIIIGFVITISINNDVKNDQYTKKERLYSKKKQELEIEDKKNISKEEIENPNQQILDQLTREIKFLNEKKFDGSIYRESLKSIEMEIILFNVWARVIEEAENTKDKEILKLSKQLKKKVKYIQVKEFPKMRKAYKDFVYQKLWLENIETKLRGKKSTILEFIGSIYVNNKMKQETQEALSQILRFLRFKRVNYKYASYDDEYTYYTLKTPKDHEIVNIIK